MVRMHWIGLLLLVGTLTGCAHMYDITDDYIMEKRCSHEAKMAWLRCRDLYAQVCYPFDFGQGFRAGYMDVCMGSEGCAPGMPPRHYWSHHYQCDEGRCQVMAWYDGYHHGVLAAQCDGCEGRCRVLCANDLYGQKPCDIDYSDIEHRVVPEDEMPNQMPMDSPYGMPMDVPYDIPMGAPAPPAGSGFPMVPGATYDVGTDYVPTAVPRLQRMLNPGIDATDAPSY